MKEKKVHVYNSNGVWKVRRVGTEKASRVFNDKLKAIQYAEKQKRKNNFELFVHNIDGSINANDTYRSKNIAAKAQF